MEKLEPLRPFKVGDEVYFEYCANYQLEEYTPRWNYLHDRGGSGVYAQGKVTQAYPETFTCSYHDEHSEERVWDWPQPGAPESEAYGRPGFIQLASQYKENSARCQCDITQLWNYGHNPDCPERKSHARSHY